MEDTHEITTGAVAATEKLEVAHILFMDIVGYAKLSMEQQAAVVRELQSLVHDTADFRESNPRGDLLSLPRGDGMALVFFRDALAPLRCAMEIARELKARPHIRLRMGINTGPVYLVRDINEDADVSGQGIVTAQRVMDCGDEGHILLSSTVAEHITRLTAWSPYVHDLGRCEVKHGQQVHLFNFYTREIGNSVHPRKVMAGYAAVVERMRTPQPKVVPSRFYAVRDGLMIVFWVCFVTAGLGAGLYAISPTVKGFFHDWMNPPAQTNRPLSRAGSVDAPPGTPVDTIRTIGSGTNGLPAWPQDRPTQRGGKQSGAGSSAGPIKITLADGTPPALQPPTIEVVSEATSSPLHGASGSEPKGDPQENDPRTETHTITVTVRIPKDGGQSRSVQIKYHDDRGEGIVDEKPNATEDDTISKPVEVTGKSVWLGVIVNDKLVVSRTYRVPDR